jgi:hypothetical protein
VFRGGEILVRNMIIMVNKRLKRGADEGRSSLHWGWGSAQGGGDTLEALQHDSSATPFFTATTPILQHYGYVHQFPNL